MKTALFDHHKRLGAKIVDFHGWQMPLSYEKGTLYEHNKVRESVGIFDVSHMGRITIKGEEAAAFIEELCTREMQGKAAMTATYSVIAREDGTAVDDLLVYKVDADTFFLVVNAGNREKDLLHINRLASGKEVTITDHYTGEGILAIQGPLATSLVSELFPGVQPQAINPFHFKELQENEGSCILSCTGYTGASGFEIYGPNALIVRLFDEAIKRGAEPIGLAARDTLRLEMGYALYGNELSDSIAPTESVARWAVHLSKPLFCGKEALLKLEGSPNKRSQYGVLIEGRAIARPGALVKREGSKIGTVTSGTFSPTLKRPIAIIMVEGALSAGESVEIEIRGGCVTAEVTPLPFIKQG